MMRSFLVLSTIVLALHGVTAEDDCLCDECPSGRGPCFAGLPSNRDRRQASCNPFSTVAPSYDSTNGFAAIQFALQAETSARTVQSFDICFQSSSGGGPVNVYERLGDVSTRGSSYSGLGGWNLAWSTDAIENQGYETYSDFGGTCYRVCDMSLDVTINPGATNRRSFMIHAVNGGYRYMNGDVVEGDDAVTILHGYGGSGPSGATFYPRRYAGAVHYGEKTCCNEVLQGDASTFLTRYDVCDGYQQGRADFSFCASDMHQNDGNIAGCTNGALGLEASCQDPNAGMYACQVCVGCRYNPSCTTLFGCDPSC